MPLSGGCSFPRRHAAKKWHTRFWYCTIDLPVCYRKIEILRIFKIFPQKLMYFCKIISIFQFFDQKIMLLLKRDSFSNTSLHCKILKLVTIRKNQLVCEVMLFHIHILGSQHFVCSCKLSKKSAKMIEKSLGRLHYILVNLPLSSINL